MTRTSGPHPRATGGSPALQIMLDDKLFERAKLLAKYLAEAEGFTDRSSSPFRDTRPSDRAIESAYHSATSSIEEDEDRLPLDRRGEHFLKDSLITTLYCAVGCIASTRDAGAIVVTFLIRLGASVIEGSLVSRQIGRIQVTAVYQKSSQLVPRYGESLCHEGQVEPAWIREP